MNARADIDDDDTVIEVGDLAAELFLPSASRQKEIEQAPQGFDPAAMFLLRMHYPNLFEPVGGQVGKVRCKGCRVVVSLTAREGHWQKHKRQAGRVAKPTTLRYRDTAKQDTSNSQGGTQIMATATESKTGRPLKTMVARDVAARVLKRAAKPLDMNTLVEKVLADAKIQELGIPKATIATQVGRAVGSEDPARIERYGRGKYIAAGVDYVEPVVEETPATAAPADAAGDDVKPDPKPGGGKRPPKKVAA